MSHIKERRMPHRCRRGPGTSQKRLRERHFVTSQRLKTGPFLVGGGGGKERPLVFWLHLTRLEVGESGTTSDRGPGRLCTFSMADAGQITSHPLHPLAIAAIVPTLRELADRCHTGCRCPIPAAGSPVALILASRWCLRRRRSALCLSGIIQARFSAEALPLGYRFGPSPSRPCCRTQGTREPWAIKSGHRRPPPAARYFDVVMNDLSVVLDYRRRWRSLQAAWLKWLNGW